MMRIRSAKNVAHHQTDDDECEDREESAVADERPHR